jgi:hypothetical protein
MATRLLLVSTLPLLLTSFNLPASGAAPPNYDDTKVSKYELPNPLGDAQRRAGDRCRDLGQQTAARDTAVISDSSVWKNTACPVEMSFQVTSTDKDALGSKATRKEVSIHFTANKKVLQMDLLLYFPNDPAVQFLPSWDSFSVAIIPFTLTRILR